MFDIWFLWNNFQTFLSFYLKKEKKRNLIEIETIHFRVSKKLRSTQNRWVSFFGDAENFEKLYF